MSLYLKWTIFFVLSMATSAFSAFENNDNLTDLGVDGEEVKLINICGGINDPCEIFVCNRSQFPIVLTSGKKPPFPLDCIMNFSGNPGQARLGYPGESNRIGVLRGNAALVKTDAVPVTLKSEIAFRREYQQAPSFYDYSKNETYVWHFIAYGAEVFITPLLGKFVMDSMPGFKDIVQGNISLFQTKIESLISYLEHYDEISQKIIKSEQELKKEAEFNKNKINNLSGLSNLEELKRQKEFGEFCKSGLKELLETIPLLKLGINDISAFIESNRITAYLKPILNMLRAGMKYENIPVALAIVTATIHMAYLANETGTIDWLSQYTGDNKLLAAALVSSGALVFNSVVVSYGPSLLMTMAKMLPFAGLITGKVAITTCVYYYYHDYQDKYGDIQFHYVDMSSGASDHLVYITDKPSSNGSTIRFIDAGFADMPIFTSMNEVNEATEISDLAE